MFFPQHMIKEPLLDFFYKNKKQGEKETAENGMYFSQLKLSQK